MFFLFRLAPWSVVVLLLWCGVTLGQRAASEPPLAGRPTDFSNIVGKYDIQATASPTHVFIEQPITLRVRIAGTGPAKFEPKREALRIFPDAWDMDFYVEEMRDDHQIRRDENAWVFVYRLRPKHAKIDAIDGIKLVYYDPDAAGKKKFVTRFVDRLPITVATKPDDSADIAVSKPPVPSNFYRLFPVDELRKDLPASMSLPPLALLGFLAGIPLACVLGAVVWQMGWPDEWEHRRRQRQRAADIARSKLRQGTAPGWEVVHQYLQDRFDFLLEEPTPAEACRHLLRLGFAKELCLRCRTLLQTCDALRYGESFSMDKKNLAHEADNLIAALEADPCAQ